MGKTRYPLRKLLTGLVMIAGILAACAVPVTPQTPSTVEPSPTEDMAGSLPTISSVEPTFMPQISPTEPNPIETPTPDPVALTNPGFEELDAGGQPLGWSSTGAVAAVKLSDRGHSGKLRLTHQSSEAYLVETSQTVTGLTNGWYTLHAWVQSSGGQAAAYLALVCANVENRVEVPSTMPGYRWLEIVVSNQVTDGQCTIRLHSEGDAGTWTSVDDVSLTSGRTTLIYLGADISSLKKSEDLGGVYRYSDGTQADALQILKDYGLNYARLRVWVDPADGYHTQETLLAMATRFKAKGIKLLVDFHYSDNWADPGKQIKPAAWQDLDFAQLKQAVYDHTFEVCSALVAQGTPPDMVQIGNEINAGMLWPDGDYNHFDNLAALLKEGVRATKDCSPSTLIMLHIAEGGDNSLARWWFDAITRRDVPFDIIGISYYPFWHGSLPELQANLNDISARYDKDVIVVETAYAFTEKEGDFLENIANPGLMVKGYPYTPDGQRAMVRDILSTVRGVTGGRGLGVFYWDATWTAVTGNGWDNVDPESGNAWENQALFDFDGRALPALEEYLNP